MADNKMKNQGLIVQIIGVLILLAGLRGFFIFKGSYLYFASIIVGIIVFAVCLFKGGALVKKSKQQE